MEKVAVLGAGSWGTALSIVLHDNGHDVRLWTRSEETANLLNRTHRNDKYLKNVTLPDDLRVYSDLEVAIEDVSAVIVVLPTAAIRSVCRLLNPILKNRVTMVHGTKGIEPDTFKRVSEMMEEELSRHLYDEIVCLSGPSHAEEVSLRHPTTVTAASNSKEAAMHTQSLFMNDYFRVYSNSDMIGVEIGGSLKNIIALGAGISDGLGFGDNAKAALVTRGLAEIARLGTRMGADPLSFIGLTGVGDLIVTCTSKHSRNWNAGNMIANGYSVEQVLKEMNMVVEGIRTTKAAYQLGHSKEIDMPITYGIHEILFEGADPREVVEQLMTRTKRNEVDEIHAMLKAYYSQK